MYQGYMKEYLQPKNRQQGLNRVNNPSVQVVKISADELNVA